MQKISGFVSSGYAEHASHVQKWNQSLHSVKNTTTTVCLQQQRAISLQDAILLTCMVLLKQTYILQNSINYAILHRESAFKQVVNKHTQNCFPKLETINTRV